MNEELKVIISAEVSKLKQGIENAKQAVKDLQGKFKEASKTLKEDLTKAGESAKNVATKIGAGFAAIGTALIGAAVGTEEYRNQQAQLKTAFEAAGASAKTATETYNGLYRVLGDGGQAQEAAQHLAKLTTEEKALKEWTTICQGVYATFGASLPIESLTEAANETAKTGTLTGALADALNWAGVSETDFQAKLDACNTEAEREALIRQTLNGLYTNAAATYEKNNAQILAQRDAQAALQEKLAAVGTAIAPVITAFTTFATDALALVVPYITNLAETYLPKLQTVLKTVADAIGVVIGWIADNWELVSTIGTVILTVVGAFTALSIAMDVVAAASAIFSMNPIVLAIGAVIAIIALCVIYWDDIKAAAVKAWEKIKEAWAVASEWFSGVVSSIQAAFASIGEWFSTLFTNAWTGIQNAWSGVKQWFGDCYKNIQNAFTSADKWMGDKFGSAWTKTKEAFAPMGEYFKNCWETVKGIFSVVKSVLSGNFSDAWAAIQKVFAGWGTFFTSLWDDIKRIFTNVAQAIGGAISNTVSKAVNSVLSTAARIINGFISGINSAISVINLIPGVSISKLSKLSVPAMAKGGIVDSATLALVGEQGKEAVLPLENNLEWLDKLAGMLNDRMGGNQPIVLNVDGKRFAEISVDSINNLTRQRGSIPLVIA